MNDRYRFSAVDGRKIEKNMGCASSSPLINGGGPGGIVETAKETASKTATEVLHAGETAIHGKWPGAGVKWETLKAC